MKVQIRENLTREITNRKTCMFSGKEKAFISRKSNPIFPSSFDDTIFGRIIENGFSAKREDNISVFSYILFIYYGFEFLK